MVEFSKYFSLLKFSIIHPKEGMDMLTAARQSHEDIKQNISEHTADTVGLEETLIQFFPNNELTKDQLIQNTKELTTHFKNYFEKEKCEVVSINSCLDKIIKQYGKIDVVKIDNEGEELKTVASINAKFWDYIKCINVDGVSVREYVPRIFSLSKLGSAQRYYKNEYK